MSKALIAIVGPSGSGKSTSLRHLDPSSTAIIDLERKGLPFKSADKFNVIPCDSVKQVEDAIVKAKADDKCKVIVVESFTKYVEFVLKLAQQCYKGYDVWNFYNKTISNFLEGVKNDKAVVVMTAIDEIVKIPSTDGSESAQRRISVKGKEHEGKVEKEFLMVLFTEPKKNDKGKIEYRVQTNTDGVTSSKTPLGMFDEPLIDNDIAMVIERVRKYYEL